MCTIALLWKWHPAAPLILAQCRDELLERPALDVERWRTDSGVEIVSGRDLLAGGTWFGIGPRVLCALTNRHDGLGPRRGARSRGELVIELLEHENVAAVRRHLSQRRGDDYGPFSLLACDGDELVYVDNRDNNVSVSLVQPGVHVLGNRGLDNPADPIVLTVDAAVRALHDADEETLVTSLREILGRHGEGWPCVHKSLPVPGAHPGVLNYGTRSAGVLLWRTPSPRLWTHASAPHDVEQWRESSYLLTAAMNDCA